jgi:predicted O-methyltransferase YrrM
VSFSLSNEVIDRLLGSTVPSFQLTCRRTRNLGFGHLFYGLTRALRPQTVLVIGSKAGFAPICFALGLKDNEGHGIVGVECEATLLASTESRSTKLDFVDPSFSIDRADVSHWYGIGQWDDPAAVERKWAEFDVQDIIRHHKTTSQDYVRTLKTGDTIDLMYVDGDHSYEGITHDFEAFHPFLSEKGVVLAHDVDPVFEQEYPEAGGYRAYCEIPDSLYEKTRLPFYPGLAICRKKS